MWSLAVIGIIYIYQIWNIVDVQCDIVFVVNTVFADGIAVMNIIGAAQKITVIRRDRTLSHNSMHLLFQEEVDFESSVINFRYSK